MKKWADVASGISIVIVLTFLSSYLEKMRTPFWFQSLCVFAAIICALFIVSKIKFLHKSVSNKVGWLVYTAGFLIIWFLSDFILK
ncbi:MAG TPA: hypothetical protein VNM69_08225 [Bacillus sp. (in: firmicutes)]|nr:hypothetical protein [Bacillus sp. (in: firmicutes)]